MKTNIRSTSVAAALQTLTSQEGLSIVMVPGAILWPTKWQLYYYDTAVK